MIGNLPPKSYLDLDLESLSNLSILLHHHRFADLRTTSSQIRRLKERFEIRRFWFCRKIWFLILLILGTDLIYGFCYYFSGLLGTDKIFGFGFLFLLLWMFEFSGFLHWTMLIILSNINVGICWVCCCFCC
jgi:hypothetical protein